MTDHVLISGTWVEMRSIVFVGPTALAGPPIQLAQGAQVVPANWSASSPNGHTIVEYGWELEPGVGLFFTSGGVSFSGPDAPTIVADPAAVLGPHTVQFRARDDEGIWSRYSTTTVQIGPGIVPPPTTAFVAIYDPGVNFIDPDTGLRVETLPRTGNIISAWLDASGNDNDLTAMGAPTLITTPTGDKAVSFNGTTDGLQRLAALNGFPMGNSDRTVVMAVQFTSAGYGGFTYGTASQNQAFGTIVAPTGNLMVQARGGANFDFDSGVAGTGAGWMVVSAVVKSGVVNHYRNGNLIQTFNHTYATVGNNAVLGVDIDLSPHMNMNAGAVYLAARALDDAERIQLENALRLRYVPPPAPDTIAPVVLAGQTFTVPDDLPVTGAVGKVVATDNIGVDSYALTAGNGAGDFAFNTATGQLTVAHALNHTTSPSYTLTFTATDAAGNTSAPVNVTITVTAPVVISNPGRQAIIDGAGPRVPVSAMTNVGSQSSTFAGQVFNRLNVSGTIKINHNDCVVRDCIVRGQSSQAMISPQRGISGLLVEYCEIEMHYIPGQPCDVKAANGTVGFLGVNTTVRYCNCWGNGDGIKAETGGLYEYNWVHASKPPECSAAVGGVHCDGIQGSTDSNWTARYNVIEMPTSQGGNFPLFAQGFTAPNNVDIYNVTFGPGNYLKGGNYTCSIEGGKNTSNDGAFVHNCKIIDNFFFRDTDFGPFTKPDGTVVDPTGNNIVRFGYLKQDNPAETYVNGNRWYGSVAPFEGALITGSNGTPDAPGFNQDP